MIGWRQQLCCQGPDLDRTIFERYRPRYKMFSDCHPADLIGEYSLLANRRKDGSYNATIYTGCDTSQCAS